MTDSVPQARKKLERTVIAVGVVIALLLVGLLVLSVVNIMEHREATRDDHDCIVELALVLTDPARDVTTPPNLPEACQDAPAAGRVTGG